MIRKMRMRPTHLRARLTLWYVSVFAALLILAWVGTCALLFWQLRSQLDHFAIEEIETVEGLFYFDPSGQLFLREDYHNHPQSKDVIERFLEIRDPDGAVLFRNQRLGNRALGGVPFAGEGVGGYSPRSARLADGTRVRLVSRLHSLDGRLLLIRLAHSEEPLYSRLKDLLLSSLLVLPVMLLIAAAAGYGLARRALDPIQQMVQRAREITPENLHARLPNDDADDELGQLARVFNQTLSRLEQAFEQLRRFTSDASHELRTPLAMIRSVGEVGLQKDGTRTDYRDIVGSMLEEVNRLTSLIDNLLTISRADAGHIQLHRTIIPLIALAREAAGLFEILVEEKSQHIVVEGDEDAQIDGDYIFLRQALVNVIHNAVKYSPVGGLISVCVGLDHGNHVIVEVRDRGPGIPVEDQARVFDRFYRVDKARWRESGGTGLGLSIVKWAVEAHGGTVTLNSNANEGCTFRITLSAAGSSAKPIPVGKNDASVLVGSGSPPGRRGAPETRQTA
jgi:heavy metal sensor kinase